MDERVASPTAVEPDGVSYPPIAEDAADLKQLKKVVEDAAGISGGLWLSYLFVLFYLAVAAGAVTHLDLFLERPVKLPFLSIELPLLAFFFLAPLIFLISHVYTLIHFVLLSDKVKTFQSELDRQVRGADGSGEAAAAKIRTALCRQLPSNIFVQVLAGPEDLRSGAFGLLLNAIAWATMVIGPVFLLLLIQVQFLPYHSPLVTWAHRLALLIDLVVLWWLWRAIFSSAGPAQGLRPALSPGFVFGIAALVFSWAVATFPGEWQDAGLLSSRTDRAGYKTMAVKTSTPRNIVLELRKAVFGRHRPAVLSSTLVLTGTNLYEALSIDDPKKVELRHYLFHARNRDLREAVFDFAVLPKIDFTGSRLQGASFEEADLHSVTFDGAQMQGVSMYKAHLRDASLHNARMSGSYLYKADFADADLGSASLQETTLTNADLRGTLLLGAFLQGASLDYASLQGASLGSAFLQGASFAQAQLQGASLDSAELRGASFKDAKLQATSFEQAKLEGTSFRDAQLQGASFDGAALSAVDFGNAMLWRSTGNDADVANASADGVQWAPVAVADDFAEQKATWTNDDYLALKRSVAGIKSELLRAAALERLQRLACTGQDKAPCGPPDPKSSEGAAWRETLEHNRSSSAASYRDALANVFRDKMCAAEESEVHVIRGLATNGRLAATGPAAADLVSSVKRKTCPVSSFLDQGDDARFAHVVAAARDLVQ